jgi:hypothetical protein
MISNTKVKACFLVLAILFLSSAVFASSTWWYQGVVTRPPWQDEYRHIMIDNKLYTFMPEATCALRWQNPVSGNFGEKTLSWRQIRAGQKVWIKIQGRRIYKLFVSRQ